MTRENPWGVLARAAFFNTATVVLWPFGVALAVLAGVRDGFRAIGRKWRQASVEGAARRRNARRNNARRREPDD